MKNDAGVVPIEPEMTGNQLSLTAKTMMSRNANAYGAIDSPSMLTVRLIRSAMPLGLRAASTATTIDSASETASA